MHAGNTKLLRILLLLIIGGYAWLFLNLHISPDAATRGEIPTLCFVKQVSGYPCPSCGTTRSVIALLHGNWLDGFLLNPFGYLVLTGLLLIPLWLLYDFFLKKESLWIWYAKAEHQLQKGKLAIVLIAMVMANWIWNFYKGY